ncbi:helix-turn-helix transcriptional regulator [Marinobacter hydrocarbonoclasticus]|nr:helix-turn-helix transcriptional regulator [Marinobacter nauticus]
MTWRPFLLATQRRSSASVDSYNDIPTVTYRQPAHRSPGIEVLDLSLFRAREGRYRFDPFSPHRVSYFCFIYIEQGCGQHWVDGVAHPYHDGSVIFVNQDQFHAFDRNDQPTGKMINITPGFFAECAANIRKSYFVSRHYSLTMAPVLPMDATLNKNCRELLEQISEALKVVAANEHEDDVVVQLLFSALMIKLARARQQLPHTANECQRNRFTEFLNRVERDFAQDREAKSYAAQMGLTYKALNQLCKRCCGHTAKQMIDFRLNLEITRKLSMKGGTIQSIAFELGFDDTTNFVRYFKRHNGVTPSTYRAQAECLSPAEPNGDHN